MKKPKRQTDIALEKRREATVTRLCMNDKPNFELDMRIADRLEAEAASIIAINEPPITNMGEVTQPHIPDLPGRYWIKDTLQDGGMVTEEASISRTDLLQQPNLDISALAIDAAHTVQADNSLEKMLAHQLALMHEMAMKVGNAAMGELGKIQHQTSVGNGLRPGAATEFQRLTNSAARLMGTYQQGMLTLQRLRTGGNQTMTVQHVNVGAGGQAVIGNVQTGGRSQGADKKND